MNKNEQVNYESKLKRERERFKDWLGSVSRYILNKRVKDIKYHG